MLKALAQPDNPNYQYHTAGNIPTGTGRGSAIGDTVAGFGVDTLAPQIAGHVGNYVAQDVASVAARAGGEAGTGAGIGAGFGGAAGAAGLGLATELGSAYLKPKGQAPTESPYGDLTDQYRRREEGSGEGIAGGAVKWGGRGAQVGAEFGGPVGAGIGAGVGALAGAIGGAFTKNAKSAYSDFRTQDAVEAIKKMYQTRGGRLPTEQEVEQILVGQGMDAADARQHTGFVGEKGLYSVLNSLDKNFAAERQHLVDQAGSTPGGTGAAPTTPQPVAQPAGAPAAPAGAGAGSGPAAQGSGGNYPQQPPGPPGVPPGGAPGGIPPSTPPPQASTPPAQPGAPPAPPAPPAAPALPANADTDGYAAPAYTVKPTGPPPPGWDAKKWTDDAHQTPKYVVGRILAQFAPTADNMPKVLAEIQKAYPGTTLIGKDTINIPGVGKTDILRGADVGGKGWQWLGEHAQQSGGAAGGTGGAGAGYNAMGDVSGQSTIAQIIAQLSQMSGGQPQGAGVMSARDAVLNQFRGA
jgi:hypothetical protein